MLRLLGSLLRVLRRDPELVGLAIRVYILLIVMRGVVRLFPLRRIASHLGLPSHETPVDGVPPNQLRFARRVGWTIRKLAPHTPTNSNCYPQALTARWLLHHKGIPSTVYYGAAYEDGRSALEAHVWLRCGPTVVTGGAIGRTFQPLSAFADSPLPRKGGRRSVPA